MDELNLHFTGDFHAITSANNLCAALLDNHIQQGNELNIDTRNIRLKRCEDMNDRVLRNIVVGLGAKADGYVREDHFVITVASEIMAILCLATDLEDLRARLSRMVVAYDVNGNIVTASDLKAVGAMMALLKDAMKPNLIQTLEHTPALVHGGPFANIAHGCNSVRATKAALKMGEIAITEAGFGADLGAEKFLDIKCRAAGLVPDAVVVVATVRALKMHGGLDKTQLAEENLEALEKGIPNLLRHVSNIRNVYGLPCVVAVNRFPTDTDREIAFIMDKCAELGVNVKLSTVWAEGGAGGIDLAEEVVDLCEHAEKNFRYSYSLDETIEGKIESVTRKVYGGDGIIVTPEARKQIDVLEKLGFNNVPVCIAKTQYSFTDDPKKLGAPEGFKITVKNVKISAGAGFVVVLTGDIMTMPGLPKHPAAERIDVDEDGRIVGIF
jgi:formate--tetrahydrofolate ligase